jgi:hypothetical protein
MTDESSERAKLIDVSDLPDGLAKDPNWAKVREVSERGGFLDRSPAPRSTRRHLTGRNQQFNAKATADTIRRFNAICDEQRWVAGLALEHLVALGEAALRLGTITEAIEALGKAGQGRGS